MYYLNIKAHFSFYDPFLNLSLASLILSESSDILPRFFSLSNSISNEDVIILLMSMSYSFSLFMFYYAFMSLKSFFFFCITLSA